MYKSTENQNRSVSRFHLNPGSFANQKIGKIHAEFAKLNKLIFGGSVIFRCLDRRIPLSFELGRFFTENRKMTGISGLLNQPDARNSNPAPSADSFPSLPGHCFPDHSGLPMLYPILLSVTLGLIILGPPNRAQAQMVKTSLPFTTVNNSFYERIGIDFGFSLRGSRTNNLGDRARGVFGLGPGGQLLPNITFSQGSVNSAIPLFGGYDPNADATFGYRVQNGSGGYHLGFRLGQGSNRSIVNTTPVLMTRNGYPGSIFSGSLNPFVTGIQPVVGGGNYLPSPAPPTIISPLEMKLRQLHMDRMSGHMPPINPEPIEPESSPSYSAPVSNSSAARGDLSVREIKRIREREQQAKAKATLDKVLTLKAKAEKAIRAGHAGAARSYLRTAIRYATGNLKEELKERFHQLQQDN